MGETKGKPHTKGMSKKGVGYSKPKSPKKVKTSVPKKRKRKDQKNKRIARRIWRKLI